jgi:NAD(P)H-nitrite reductase large subunit
MALTRTAADASSYVIIGNGIAGITAAEILRTEDTAADITVIADDPFPAYYRPALKDYLAGRVREDKLWARHSNFYQDHSIRFLADRVTGIQVERHALELQSGRQLGYQTLLLAQGARARSLSCSGVGLRGVTTLRTVADYQQVEHQLSRVRCIVVTGSGTLALETLKTLRHRGGCVSTATAHSVVRSVGRNSLRPGAAAGKARWRGRTSRGRDRRDYGQKWAGERRHHDQQDAHYV